MPVPRWLAVGALGVCCAHAGAAVTSYATPAALEAGVGGPLFVVPDDGLPVGTMYGTGGGVGIPLGTPFGPMSFAPVHDKVAPGVYHPFVPFALAGSDIIAPSGAIALDFMFTTLFHGSFVITAVGSMTMSDPVELMGLVPGVPVYVGFGAAGETIDLITIETAPFGATPPFTWEVGAIRVLPAPGALAGLAFGGLCLAGRRRR
ncbi:MAG: hypothetical protein KDA05_01070 [Phycisphaerales bacterium]|nr:hypothetical protein [Phycisphaerales bacterium]